nr:hypothetical protein [Sunxiuqinia sp.]
MKLFQQNILILSFSLFSLGGQAQEEIRLSGSFQNLSFSEFVEQLETEYPVHFYYKEAWVESLKVNVEVQSLSIPELMEKVLQGTKPGFAFEPPGSVYLLPEKGVLLRLPDFDSRDISAYRNET